MTIATPPQSDEFELSVFGPGRGECVLVHLGHNEWCMIDSCCGKGRSLPAAVEYLNGFGQTALDGVLLVLATHWHDDHIRGLAESLRSFPNARFACSTALKTEQFFTLVQLQTKAIQGDSGLDEFRDVLEIIKERKHQGVSAKRFSPVWAIQDRSLLRRSDEKRGFPAIVTALSPSDITVQMALNKIVSLIPSPDEPQRRITNPTPNEASVVLMVEVGDRVALLGADLEHSGRPGEGWLAIVGTSQSVRPANILKVPHHGSPNADCPDIWTTLLAKDPIAVLTPFTSGKGLPQDRDIARIKGQTPNLYCTAKLKSKLPRRDQVVEKTLRRRKITASEGKLGHVRIRWSVTDAAANPAVELFNGAYPA